MRLPFVIVFIMALSLTGCAAWPERDAYTASQLSQANVLEGSQFRFWADPEVAEIPMIRRHFAPLQERVQESGRSLAILALSAGSDSGAYSAGLLAGWTETGKRPEFDLVTGVSAGAFIAPFAFLGSEYDDELHTFFTKVRRKDVFRQRLPLNALLGPSVADSGPLRKMIDEQVDTALLTRFGRNEPGAVSALATSASLASRECRMMLRGTKS